MSTEIQWTDERLRELAFCVPAGIVPADKRTRPAVFVVPGERPATATTAARNRIRFTWLPAPVRKAWAVLQRMVSARREDLDILRPVVGLDAIDVVRDFAWTQGPPELLLGDEPVLIDVAAYVSEMMARQFDQHISAGRDCATALPVRVSRAGMNDAHALRVARGVLTNVS